MARFPKRGFKITDCLSWTIEFPEGPAGKPHPTYFDYSVWVEVPSWAKRLFQIEVGEA